MLKEADSLKGMGERAAEVLEAVLKEISIVRLEHIDVEPQVGSHHPDLLAHLTAAGHPYILVCEVKSSGQPRYVREGLLQLRNFIEHTPLMKATPLFIAPYLSPEARTICRDNKVGYLDFQGNVRLEFGGVFI